MLAKFVAPTVSAAALIIAACQSGGPAGTAPGSGDVTLSKQELAELEVSFETATIEPPERSAETLLKRLRFQDVKHRSACNGQPFYDDRGDRAATAKAKNEKAKLYVANGWRQAATHAVKYGNFGQAIDYIRTAATKMPDRWKGDIAGMRFAESILYSMVGFDEDAADAYAFGRTLMGQSRASGATRTRVLRRVRPGLNAARGFLLKADGDLAQAEMLLKSGTMVHTGSSQDGVSRPLIRYYHIQALIDLNRLGEAEAIARDLALQRQEPLFSLWAYDALASVFLAQGRFEEAEEVARRAYDFFKNRCAPMHYFVVARANLRLAQALTGLGRWDDALILFDEIDAARRGDDSGVIDSILFGTPDWGVALLAAQRPADAVRRLDTAAKTIETLHGAESPEVTEVQVFQTLATLQSDRSPTTVAAFEQAMERYATTQAGAAAGGTGDAGRERRTEFLIDRFLDFAANDGTPARQAAALRYAQLGQGGKVQAALAAGAVRQEIDDPDLRGLVRKQQNAANRALEIGRLILARSSMAAETGDGASVEELIEERKRLEAASRQLLQEIETRHPEFSALISNRPAGIGPLQAVMRPDEAVLYVRSGEEVTHIWALSATGPVKMYVAPIPEKRIAGMVARIRRTVDPTGISSLSDIPDFNISAAKALYDALIRPAESVIGDAGKLIVVTDGALRQLPLSLLVRAAPKALLGEADDADGVPFTRYRTVTWLADSHAVTALPTLNGLTLLRRGVASIAERPLIAFGDPFFSPAQARNAVRELADGTTGRRGAEAIAVRSLPETRALNSAALENLPRLPETRDEISAIGATLGADPDRDLILGERATEAAVRSAPLDRYRIVAFATHGLTAGDLDGLHEPALAMTTPKLDSGTGDGLLTMSEILNLQLNADWVVLSACNTAAADGEGAEAVAGLGRAFFYAGARALLVSNWPVHSKATEALTTTAFEAIRDRGVSRDEGMRLARKTLIRERGFSDGEGRMLFSYAHPLFWAPFVVVGD